MDNHDALDSHVVPEEIQTDKNFKTLFEEAKDYLNRYGRVLFQTLSIYALPIILFAFLANYLLLNTGTQIENLYYLKGHLSKNDYILLLFNILIYITGLCIMTLVTNVILTLSSNSEFSNREQFSVEVKKEFTLKFGTYILNFLIIFIFYYVLKLATLFLASCFPFDEENGLDLTPYNYEMNIVFQAIMSLIIMPIVLYYGFSTLYVSLRDNVAATDALQKVNEISGPNLRRIWLLSIALYVAGLFCVTAIGFVFGFLAGDFSLRSISYIVFFIFQKVVSIALFALMNVASVLLFNGIERTVEKATDNLEEIQASEN